MKRLITKLKPKWLLLLALIFPITFVLSFAFFFDNDLWYLLTQGKYLLEYGIFFKDPFTIHPGLNITVQNLVSSIIFWQAFNLFGTGGITFLVVLSSITISYLLYRICLLISDNNYYLSVLLSLITSTLLAFNFIVTRPQIFSFILILLLILFLELYIKKQKWVYLIAIPIISFLQVNLHASLWWMLFLFIIPYLLDSFKIKFLKTQGYPWKPLLLFTLLGLAVGLLNPYGINALTFIFSSYGNSVMHSYIRELSPFSFSLTICKEMLLVIIINFAIYALFRNGKVRLRYICLFLGTMLLGFMAIKSIGHFILVSFFPLAYFFKDIFPKDFSKLSLKLQVLFKVLVTTGIIIFTFIGVSRFCYYTTEFKLKHVLEPIFDKLEEDFTKDEVRMYTSFNIGGYAEYRGFKTYIDPRAEVFLKANNHRKDILEEYVLLTEGKIDKLEFIKSYNFTHILAQQSDPLYQIDSLTDTYVLYYEDKDTNYYLYVRRDLIS